MSFLNNTRLAFSGKFQSDVSTVNNDVRHFSNAAFKEEYQEYSQGPNANGWWNPCGSGAFRLIDCVVTQVGYQDGSTTSDPEADAAVGMFIGGSNDLVSGKMVDLDPQMQLVSQIWGLEMRVTDGKKTQFVSGKYQPACFRDILFGRQQGGAGGDQTAAAIYESVLTDLEWAECLEDSRVMQQLKDAIAVTGKLSVRMMVYSYNMNKTSPEFTIGRVSGVIGPALPDEPDSFILGRRFAPADGNSTAEKINFFDAQLDTKNRNLAVDLSNALPLDGGDGDFVNLGDIQLVVLNKDQGQGDSGLRLDNNDYVPLGGLIPYLTPNWMNETAALHNVTNLTEDQLALLGHKPLALLKVTDQSNVVLIREEPQGLLVRAEQVVNRLSPGDSAEVDFYVARYGVPSVGETVEVTLQPAMSDQGDGPGNVDAKIPDINVPADAISISQPLPTDNKGKTSVTYSAAAPKNPREYIDGQVYLMGYSLPGSSQYIQQFMDLLANLVWDEVEQPDPVYWEDIQPILLQYGNLYPVMSRMLVDLGNYDSVCQYRSLLELAFAIPVENPNHMPVTRDLSPGRRKMILSWLTAKDANGQYTLLKGDDSEPAEIEACPSCSLEGIEPVAFTPASIVPDEPVEGSKERASKQFQSTKSS